MTPPPTTPTTRKKRGESWSEEGMRAAMNAVQRGNLTQRQASTRYNIPRRTLRDHLKQGSAIKRLGRKPILTKQQEDDLAVRIKRFATIGVPLTPKFIRKQAFLFCERYDIKNVFNESKRAAGKDWLRKFLKRNPSITKRKPQIMNPARAQKLNKSIVKQHFEAVKKLYDELDILRNPERLYNMDEKGCRITVHKPPTVLAEKGNKRVHLIAPEHAENVTIAMCINAIGTAIPPMILFKGKRQRSNLTENLPAGSLVRMAPKGSMTSDIFVEFIQHLGKYKVAGKCLLIFDGAKCHLSIEALDEADKNDIVLYCLPSNTTHELQPLDKSVNKSYEHHWDEAVMNFLNVNADKNMTKATFNKILAASGPNALHIIISLMALEQQGFTLTTLKQYLRKHLLRQYCQKSRAMRDNTASPSLLVEPTSYLTRELSTPDLEDNSLDDDFINSLTLPIPPRQLNRELSMRDSNPSSISPKPSCSHWPISVNLTANAGRLVDYSSSSGSEDDTECPTPSPPILASSYSDLQTNRETSPVPSNESPESGVDFLHHQSRFKLTVAEVYGRTSSEEDNDIQNVAGEGEIIQAIPIQGTPQKQIINSRDKINITNSDDAIDSDEDNFPLSVLRKNSAKTQFQELLPTPNYAKVKKTKPRKKAINYKGQRITKDLFEIKQDKDNNQEKGTKQNVRIEKTCKGNKRIHKEKYIKKVQKNKRETKKSEKKKERSDEEEWYCHACCRNEKSAMRQCSDCKKWYHEECVGLTKKDKYFVCSDC